MDIVEFAEKFMKVELLDYQKQFLRDLDKLRAGGNIRIICGPRCRTYIYLDKATRQELIKHG